MALSKVTVALSKVTLCFITSIFSGSDRSEDKHICTFNYCLGRRSQKIDDLLILVTCRSGTLAILSNKVNGPVAHGSTLIWLMEAVD